MHNKKISIITPSLNRVDMLEGVINNVVMQRYPNFEHIIIDGGSTDGTQDMIKKYAHVRFECGPDQGMYDALNKGLNLASGEIIGFLNTDDFYAENIFWDVASNFDDESMMAVAGSAIVFYESAFGKAEIIGRYSPNEKTLLECSTIGSNYFNAWFFRSTLFKKFGQFDASYRIAGDKDFMLRLALNNLHYVVLDKLVYQYRQHPGSLTFHDTDERREWSAKEQLIMTAHYLNNESLSDLERKLIVELRTRETVDMVIRTIKVRDFRKIIYYFSEGLKYDFFWPFKFTWLTTLLGIRKMTVFAKKIVSRISKLILKV